MQNKIQNNSPFQKRDKISKAALFIGLFLMIQNVAFSQTNGSVGIGTTATTPYANAVLDVSSTTKGVLLPRLTDAQRLTLTALLGATANGLMIYNVSTLKFNYWDGTKWNDVGGGAKGEDGSVWYAGSIPPKTVPSNSLGKQNDFFLDGVTGDVYKKDFANTWVLFGGANPVNLKNANKREVAMPLFNLATNGSTIQTFAFIGAVVGNAAIVSPKAALPNGVIISYARVSAPDVVEVKFYNIGNATSVEAGDFEIAIIK
jgi:hypothetical protein